ncbi:MAG: LysR family transcriptional regulator [Planctomycetaceae bacterium]|nr:LysR family transcriptional regulator [Planctomycetaceae bacterium]
MHLRNVEIFCEVVSLRSFSKAAEVHHVSQSSASQAVHQLEKRLETLLIDRSKRPFELTAAGRIYYEGCRDLLEGFRQIEDQVRQAKDQVAGRVRVAAIYSVGLLQMDAYVKQFEERYPDTELQLEYLHPEGVYDRVLQDSADIGLVSFPKDGGEIGCIPWWEQEIVLVVPPSHRLAGKTWTPIDELNGEKFVSFTRELTIRRQIDRWLKQAKVSVHVVHEFDNIENIKRAVEIGAGIGLLPGPTVRREIDSGSLWAVQLALDNYPPDKPLWKRPLGIVHKRHRTLSTAASKFVELLHEEPDSLPGTSQSPSNAHSSGTSSRRQTVS